MKKIEEILKEPEIPAEPIKQRKKSSRLILKDEQKLIILNRWNESPENPPGVLELAKLINPNCSDDLSNDECKAVRAFLGRKNLVEPMEKPIRYELTKEHKEYIKNHYKNEKPYEMARILWNEPMMGFSDSRTRLIAGYVEVLDKNTPKNPDEPQQEYKPTTSTEKIVNKINTYVKEAELDLQKLDGKNKKRCEALINYLHNTHFVHQMNLYSDVTDRILFESSFIETIWDKSDLEIEDIQQYIILATEKVMSSNIQKTIVLLQEEQDRNLIEEGKLSMSLVEAVTSARGEYNSSIARQQKLYKVLTEERSKRLSDQVKEHASILNLINAWKNYESRQKLLKLAQGEKKKLRKEVEELENLDEMKIRLLGLSIDEVVNG